MSWDIPLYTPVLGAEEQAAVGDVIASGMLSGGTRVVEFEQAMAKRLGAHGSVFVSSCTAALHLALLSLDLKPGDEVIVPSLSFVATASTVYLAGGRPVFADIASPQMPVIGTNQVRDAIGPKTRAVVTVHYGGYPAHLGALRSLCDQEDLPLIEDAAHAPVVASDAGMVGTVGDIACFSFFATKNVTTGEGGLITARAPSVLDGIRIARNHGLTISGHDRGRGALAPYDVLKPGFNYRGTDIAAALGLTQLARLERDRQSRCTAVARYRERLASARKIDIPFSQYRGDTAHHLFTVLTAPNISRDLVRVAMHERGIQTGFHYPPIHTLSCFREQRAGENKPLPNTEAASRRLITLPLFSGMSLEAVDRVCDALIEIVEE